MAISFPFASNLISSKYGPRVWNGAQTVHTGVDFAVSGNRAIPAADEGTITKIEYTNLKGYQVEIQHSAAARTRYHMLRSDVLDTVKVGQYVSKGQTIGHIAPVRYNPAAAWTGPHLHWEVWLRLVRSDGSPYDSWRHVDPQQRWTNAGGPNGYTPTEPSNTGPATGGGTTPIESDDDVEYSKWSDESKRMFQRDMWTGSLHGGVPWEGNVFPPMRLLVESSQRSELAAQRAGWAAESTAVGESGVRNDGPLAAMVRAAGVSASNAARDSALAARDSKYAADYVAVGQQGVRNDGQTAALIRQGVNAALAAKLTAADIDAIANAVKAKLQ